MKLNYIGTIAAILGPIALLFEILKIIKIKSASQLSWLWILTEVLVCILWLIFGIANKITPTIISAILFIILSLILIYLKLSYK